ncbi:C45 family peptidase [Maritimibacter sp. HL-12]|uniref:C45 family autoproteolytic acyltransferase/hydolase n=1 Tax=Maritimibacter sp. HL-12 TaxID=1162418 RepID=UPI000A0F3F06|nr:C45 family peptidase [Maritimibacter sp. HL-12]SMH28872.1 isopenicillin-N N-acyltransferase like protein [Maritimibacter sp. HL-12]
MNAVHDVIPPAAFPFLRTEGAPADVGRAHGRAFGDRVLASVGVYRRKFDAIGLPWDKALAFAGRNIDYLRSLDPALVAEMDGIAEGAEVPAEEIYLINIRTGLTRMVEEGTDEDHECTTAAMLGEATADGHTLMAQNWDQHGDCQANTVVIEQHIPGEPALLFITEAGILFRHGMNDAGVGVVGNALRTNREKPADRATTSHIARRRALRCTTFDAAVQALRDTPRSHSGNHIIAADGQGAVDVEAVPGETFLVHPRDGIVVHSNHFLNADACATLEDRGRASHPDTLFRDCRLRDALSARRGAITIADVRAALADHHGFPVSVCRHPDPAAESNGYTLVSSVIDLTARRMCTAPGPACVGTYTEYAFT